MRQLNHPAIFSEKDILRHNRNLPRPYQNELCEEFARAYKIRGKSPRILLIGGAGYIGSVLTRHLLDCGYSVRVLDALLYGQEDVANLFENLRAFEFLNGDFTDGQMLQSALDRVTDVVVLAGLVGDPVTQKYPEVSQAINVDGMIQLVRILKQVELNKVIFISTCSNYGFITEDSLADENFELRPLSLYAKAKVLVERELLALKGEVSFVPIILRFATAFGLSPRMRFDLTVNEFTREAFLGNVILAYDVQTWRPYCHVRDLSLAIQRTLEAPQARVNFQVFNVGGQFNNVTKEMILNAIKHLVPTLEVRLEDYGSDPRNYKVDFTKVKERLFFAPQFSVMDGISEVLVALQNGSFRDYEARKIFYGNYTIEYTPACSRAS